jgi:hypothetical protein
VTSQLDQPVQHAVPSVTMTEKAELEQRLRSLVRKIERAQTTHSDLVHERNEVMRELNREHGVRPTQLAQQAGLKSRQLADRITKGQDR